MATPRPSYLARKRVCKTETTSWLAPEAAAERPPCVRMRAPSPAAPRPRPLRPHEGNRSPSNGNQQRWSTRPADHSTARHDPAERIDGFSSAALEPRSQPATHALPSQQPSPSTPAAGSRQAFWLVPPIVLEHAVCMHFGNQHHIKVDPRVAFTRHSNGARECLMAGCDGTWQEICAAASFGVRSLPGCRATTLTTIRSRMLSKASECAADCTRARGVHARWQSTSCKSRPLSHLHEAQQWRTRVFDGWL